MDDEYKALAKYQLRLQADSLTVLIQLAARTHPDELRKALASVFDLSGVEERSRRAMLVVSETQQMAMEVKHLLEEVVKDIDRLEARIDALHYNLEKIKGAFG